MVAETEWLAGLIAAQGLKTVIVAQARLDGSDIEYVLAQHARSGLVRGVRHIPRAAAAPDKIERGAPGTLGDPLWRKGYAHLARFGFSFDLQVPFWHLEEGADLARAFPMTPLIVNSAGFPIDRGADGLALWRRGLRALSKEPNVSIKIAGLGTGAGIWPVAANVELIRFVLDTFGPDRCMIGSNFPPDRLAASFGTIMTGIMTALAVYAPTDQAKILSSNTMRIYRI